MRIAFVAPSLSGGGAERSLCELAGALADRGHAVDVVTYAGIAPRYPLSPQVAWREANLPRLRWHSPVASARALRGMRRQLTRLAPDVIVSFLEGTNELVLLATLGLGTPRVASFQNEIRHHPATYRTRALRALLYPLAERVVFLDETIPAPRAWRKAAIPNLLAAIGTESRKPPGNFARTLVAMGRLVPQKGFDLLLQAFRAVSTRHPEWGLVIFGEGPEHARLRDAAKDLPVVFAGAVANPFPYLRGADLFAFSSRYEGQGMAIMEAMACGLPAVSFACPTGPGKIVRDGVDGLLVPPNDVVSFSLALSRLMGDAELRARYAARAPEITARFPAAPIIEAWELLFDEAVSSSRHAGRKRSDRTAPPDRNP